MIYIVRKEDEQYMSYNNLHTKLYVMKGLYLSKTRFMLVVIAQTEEDLIDESKKCKNFRTHEFFSMA